MLPPAAHQAMAPITTTAAAAATNSGVRFGRAATLAVSTAGIGTELDSRGGNGVGIEATVGASDGICAPLRGTTVPLATCPGGVEGRTPGNDERGASDGVRPTSLVEKPSGGELVTIS